MLEALFAFAIEVAGYKEFCQQSSCPMPQVQMVEPSDHTRRDHNGWYNFNRGAVVFVKTRAGMDHQALREEMTTVHEMVHYLQYLSGRHHGLRGPCNRWLGEKEAHEAGEAWALKRGYKVNRAKVVDEYEQKCRASVALGLVKDPGLK